jgi:hypothetical protein
VRSSTVGSLIYQPSGDDHDDVEHLGSSYELNRNRIVSQDMTRWYLYALRCSSSRLLTCKTGYLQSIKNWKIPTVRTFRCFELFLANTYLLRLKVATC